MYVVVDSTDDKVYKLKGDMYPTEFITNLLNKGHKIVVISTYSNTIKYNFRLLSPCCYDRDEIKF